MENTIKISCSAVTHIGSDRVVNENRIYANGKFLQPQGIDHTQISLEASGKLFIFALSDGMDMDADTRISITDELKKFHRKAAGSTKDIQVKLDEMTDNVQQANNLLYSMSLGEQSDSPHNTAFAGLLIDGGNIAAVNLGNCRIYKVEADIIKPMIYDNRRTDRLLKMGIINNEQAEMLTGQQKNSVMDNLQVKKSDIFPAKQGNEYLLCSSSLIDALGEEMVFEIITDTGEPDAAASQLIREAVESGCEDSVSAILVRVEQANEEEAPLSTAGSSAIRRIRTAPARYTRIAKTKSLDMSKLVTTFIVVAVIAAVLFGAFTLWMKLRDPDKDVLAQNTTEGSQPGKSTADDTLPTDPTETLQTESSTSLEGVTPDGGEGDTVGDNTTYTVKSGDSLMKISKKFYGDEGKYKLIMQANGITDPNKITVDQELKIPPENQ